MATYSAITGIPASSIISFPTEAASDAFLFANPNTTQGVYQFAIDYGCSWIQGASTAEIDACYAANHTLDQVVGIKYVVQYNQTSVYYRGNQLDTQTMYYLPMVNTLERAIMQTLGNVSYQYTISKYPHPLLPKINIIATVGPAVIFAAVMFNLVIQVGLIVVEKELKLRESMRVMGLIDGVYWFSWIILNCVMNIIAAFLLIAAGCLFQMSIFLKNDFGTYAILLILFGLSMVPVGLLLAAIIDQASTATTAGFAVFLVGSLIQFFAPILYEPSVGTAAPNLFSLFPFVVFSKGLTDLADATSNQYQNGLRWSQITNNDYWPLSKTYEFLILDFFIFLVIALYVDNINYGGRSFYFFLTPSYWRGHPSEAEMKAAAARREKKRKKKPEEDLSWMDSDVRDEENLVKDGKGPGSNGVVLSALTKTYSKGRYLCFGKISFKAVKEVFVSMEDDQLFCLLGHNGAGKSTTIGMLTGLFAPTDGDAYIFGSSITTSMDKIRESMGVCPQHDILWDQLTAKEHLELYAGLKRLYGTEMEEEIKKRLEDVALTSAADSPCGNYSGGMKRRLSVSIALIGDPRIVFLDEPTTGMDPVSRRQVWNLIERVKKGRIILLTTHSMEEADVLGDKIAIMKGGRLACLGTSLHLKQKFGTGYLVSVIGSQEKSESLHSRVLEYFGTSAPPNHQDIKTVVNGNGHENHMDMEVEMDANDDETSSDEKKKQQKKKSKSKSNAASPSSSSPSIANGSEGKARKKGIEMQELSQQSSEEEDYSVVKRTAQDGPLSKFRIPLDAHDQLPGFFASLESSKTKLGINAVQLQMTTLEDVFLRVAEQDEVIERPPTAAEIRKKKRKTFNKWFWIAWVLLLLVGALVAIIVGFSLPKKDNGSRTPGRAAEPPTFVPLSNLSLSTFPGAIQISDATMNSAILSTFANTSHPLTLFLMLGIGSTGWNQVNFTTAGGSNRNPSGQFIPDLTTKRVQLQLTGLQSDSVYNVYFQDSVSGMRSDVSRFRTPMDPGANLRNITFGATSAFGLTDAPYPSMLCVASQNPDFIILPGDLVYAQYANTFDEFVALYDQLLQYSGFYAASTSTSLIATWNDQEFREGWVQNLSNSALQLGVQTAKQAFDTTFPHIPGPGAALNSQHSVPGEPPAYSDLWRSITWGKQVEIFVLDLQYERDESQLISVDQMNWLKSGLINSQATFKLIVSSISITDVSPLLLYIPNSWTTWESQRMELIDWITNNNIYGVLFISGGPQFGMSSQAVPAKDPKNLQVWSTYNVTEAVVGPAGTYINPSVRLSSALAFATQQFHGLIGTWSTSLFTLDPRTGTVVISYLDDNCLIAYNNTFFLQPQPK